MTLTVRVWNNEEKIKYIDPSTNREMPLTKEENITIPAGQLSIPFTFDATDFPDDDEYTELVRKFVTQISFTLRGSPPVRVLRGDGYDRLSLRWIENDIPNLSLKFADDADNDEVLEAGDSFKVVVGTKPEISNDGLRIDATLKAYADGVALDWPLPSVTIPAGETETLPVPIEVPGDRMADIEGKYVVLKLEKAVVQEIDGKMRTDARLKPTATLTLNAGKPKVSLNTDSLTLVEGESATVTVTVKGDIRGVADETLTLIVSDEKFKDDYRVKPSYITLRDAKAGTTFEIEAVNDEDYDPGESFVLELKSSSSTIQLGSDYRLEVNIDDNDPLPYVGFTTNPGSWAPYLTVEEGEVGEFWIALDRKSNYDVTLTLTTSNCCNGNEDNLRYVKYIDPGKGQEVDLTQTRTVTIPAGSLNIPFTLDAKSFEDEEYKDIYGVYIPDIVLAGGGSLVRIWNGGDMYLTVSEDDIPTLSLDFADSADDDGVLEEGDSFDVVVTTSNLIDSEDLRIEVNLKAFADGVDLGWNIPPVTINDGERGTTVTVSVPEGSVANLEDKEVVLELENAIITSTRWSRQVSLEVSNTLILNTATPKVSLSTDSLRLAEGESTMVNVEVFGSISGVADETLTLIVSDETLKDDYWVIWEDITLAQARAGFAFEIGAVDDEDYDPGEGFVLELVPSSSSTIQLGSNYRLEVDINDNDPIPVISYKIPAPWRRLHPNHRTQTHIRVVWGATTQFDVVLDRKSNRDITFKLGGMSFSYMTQIGVTFKEWSTGTGIPYAGRQLTIPAGELSVQFTIDAVSYDTDEIFDGVNGHGYYPGYRVEIVPPGSSESIFDTKNLILTLGADDIPILSLKLDDLATADGKLEAGDSFDVVVETSNVIANSFIIRANLRAYVVSPEGNMVGLGWNIPSVRINVGEWDDEITVRVPKGSMAEFVGKEIVLKLENARVEKIYHNSVLYSALLEVSNTLTLNAGPKVSLDTDSRTLFEGESGTITVELFGDIGYVGGYTLTLMQQSGAADEGIDYELTPTRIYVDGTTTQAVFEVKTFDNDDYDPDEKAVFELMPSSRAVQVVGQTEFTLNIVDDTPHISISKSSLTLKEGQVATIPIEVSGDVNLAADETFTLVSSNGAFKDDYRVTPSEITLTDAKAGFTFEVEIFESDGYDPDRKVVLELRSNSDAIEILSSTLVLNIVDNGIYASLSTNTLMLSEGEATTIRVKVDGDVSAKGNDIFMLVPSDEALRGEYRVMPAEITLTDAQDGVEFVIEAVENDIYDSDRKFVLELTSTLDTIRFATSTQLAVTVLNDDMPPHVAFAGEGIYKEGKNAYLNVDEGNIREFAIELDRESNSNVYVSVFLNDDTRVVTAEQLGDKRIPFIGLRQEPQDRGARGWSLGGDISRDYWLEIPTGTRSVTLTVNFEDIIDNRLGSLQNQDVVTLYFGIEGDTSGAITDLSSSRLTIRQVEDDTPKVSLTTNPDDPSVTVTEGGRVEVMEGSSFEVWVDLTGNEISAEFELEVTLTATVTTGAALDLELSTVTSSSGASITVDVIGDNLANGNRKVVFELERVVLKEKVAPWLTSGYELALPLPDSPTLTVYVIDDETPTVSLRSSELNLNEGQTGKVIVELRGNLDSLIDTKLGFEPQAGGTADTDDYIIPTITIGGEVSGVALKTYTVEIYASHSDGLESREMVVLQLNPSSERIDVLSPNGLRLNIVDNSPRASLSVEQLTLAEGERMTVEIVLGGDLGSIVGETLGLVPLADRNIDYPATEGEDYESSVIEVRADHYTYTIELSVTDDTAYDPDEEVKLDVGLKSEPPLSGVEFTSLNSLLLKIVNNDDFPTISFADASEKLTIIEGEVATITVELDASSNRRIEVELKFDKDNAYEATGYGYDLAGLFYPPSVVLEAGELSTELVIDARLFANDISIFDEDDRNEYEIGDLEFRISNHERSPYYEGTLKVRASEDTDNQRKIYIKDDELDPTLTLRRGQSDPVARIEVSEGETFNVWVGLSHPYDVNVSSIVGVYSDNTNRIDGIESVEISEDTSGTLYTFMVKDDAEYRSIPETVVLSFDNYEKGDEDGEQAVTFEIDGDYYYRDLNISNDFTVTVLADKIPTAQINGERGYLVDIHEGESGTIVVDLPDDLPETLTLELEPVDGTGVLASDIDISTLKVTVLRGVRQAVFNVVALDDNEYDLGEWFKFELTSPDEITILGNPIVVSIVDNDAPPTISFADSDYVAVEAGETTTIGIKLSHPSKEITTVGLMLRHSDKPGSIDAGEYPRLRVLP